MTTETGSGSAEPTHAPRSYGGHQEAATALLSQLLGHTNSAEAGGAVGMRAAGSTDCAQLVACREAAIDALHERLVHLGLNLHHAPQRGVDLTIAALGSQPGRILERALHHLPRSPTSVADQNRMPADPPGPGNAGQAGVAGVVLSPVEALGTASNHRVVELWRRVAVELTAGTHALASAATQPWLVDPGGAWHVLGDAATCVEAVAVLDVDLSRRGLLVDHRLEAPPAGGKLWSLAELRMATSQVARTAGWHATSAEVDLATAASTSRPAPSGEGQVVNGLGDLVAAQRQLAAFLQAPSEVDSFSSTLRSMDATTALVVARNQFDLCVCMRTQLSTTHHPGPGPAAAGADVGAGVGLDLSSQFARLAGTWERLLPHVESLADVDSVRGVNRAALWQQRDITQALVRHTGPVGLSQAEALTLAGATESVLRETVHATRYELNRDAGTLRQKDRLGAQPPHRVGHKGPLYRALTAALNEASAPGGPPDDLSVALPGWAPLASRRDLAATLNATATGKRPSPYPLGMAGRGRDGGGRER
ncbi:MAG: hypothetical protein WA966_15025 [Ornithinimicrobium sp.]